MDTTNTSIFLGKKIEVYKVHYLSKATQMISGRANSQVFTLDPSVSGASVLNHLSSWDLLLVEDMLLFVGCCPSPPGGRLPWMSQISWLKHGNMSQLDFQEGANARSFSGGFFSH